MRVHIIGAEYMADGKSQQLSRMIRVLYHLHEGLCSVLCLQMGKQVHGQSSQLLAISLQLGILENSGG